MEPTISKRRRVSPNFAGPSHGATSQAAGPRRKRPSFASPTKASLSRHNPEILERRRSASPMKPPGSKSVSRRASNADSNTDSDHSLSDLLTAQSGSATESIASIRKGQEEDESREIGEGLKPHDGQMTTLRRSPTNPNIRPLPPPAPAGEEDLNPFIGHTLRRSPPMGISVPRTLEPELPPSVPDPVSAKQSRGIHSNVNRWRDKPRVKKATVLKPSAESSRSRPTKRSSIVSRGSPPRERSNEPVRNTALSWNANKARRIAASDPDALKLKTRDELLMEIEKLKNDMKTANEENERLRLMHSSGRTVASANEEGVMDLLHRYVASADEPTRPKLSLQLAQAILNPIGLLPFGRTSLAVPPDADDQDQNYRDIRSHHPIPMTADEELPYLQLFSPFSVQSNLSILPWDPKQPLKQLRHVTLRSRDVPGIFTAELEILVDGVDLSILEIAVTSLEPAARFELQPFVDRICSGDCNRSMQRNIGIVSWAMGEWYRIATQRATLWLHLEQNLASKEKMVQLVAGARENQRRQPDEISNKSEQNPAGPGVCDKADLIRFLGQQAFEAKVPIGPEPDGEFTLRLEWKIGFDWTGEPQSRIALRIAVPGKWHEADERGVLGKVPRLFQNLVNGGQEPEAAVWKIMALLVGS